MRFNKSNKCVKFRFEPITFVALIKSIKGMEQKWLFDTGAGLTCMSLEAFRNISKDYRLSEINTIGKSAMGASGSTLIPEGVYMIAME
jgi:hypothetical protein